MKVRLDKLILQRGLAPSRERAQALVLAGRVLVNEQKIEKSGASVDDGSAIRILGDEMPFVSRGGLKLARGIEHWHIEVRDQVCMDIGASTGGFTDCLLQHGAAQVIAVDTGYGQIGMELRNDPRVRLLEKTNARYLTAEQIWPDAAPRSPIGLIAMDVSFISATLVLPAVVQCARESGGCGELELVVLVKPQFEVGRERVGKGGIVRDAEAHKVAIRRVSDIVAELGGKGIEVVDSPILGVEGNREFLLHARFG
jgi:23S rRNA (cytidine1920-2'-O)/16S rRNA (cytidine1409-2'-O)-methyltransferase